MGLAIIIGFLCSLKSLSFSVLLILLHYYTGPRKQGPENKMGTHKKGCKSKGHRAGKKQCGGGIREEEGNPKKQGPEGRKGKGQGCNKRKDKAENEKQNKKDRQKKKGEKEEKTAAGKQKQQKNVGQGGSGGTKRRPHLNVGGISKTDKAGI